MAAAELLLALALGAPVLLILGWPLVRLRPWTVRLAPWGAAPALLLALVYLADPTIAPAVEAPGVFLGLQLALDPLGGALLLLTALLWVAAGAYAWWYHHDDPARDRFFGLFLLTMAGNLGLVLAGDVLTFYLSFAAMTFAAYGLVVHRQDDEALRAGRVYIIMALVGEVAILFGLFALGAAGGGLLAFGPELAEAWSRLAGEPGVFPPPEGLEGAYPWVAGLLLAGFAVKAGLAPLHLWLPLAHPVAPTAASALLSGVMIKAGLLGWLRMLPDDLAVPTLAAAVVAIGAATAFYGVLMGLAQDDPKTVLAYSSVSQMGYMAVGTGIILLAPELAPLALTAVVFYALHHGVAKGALFLSVGVGDRLPGRSSTGGDSRGKSHRAEPGHPRRHAGLHRGWLWALRLGIALPALALAGAPFTSGAFAKGALKDALGELGGTWYAVLDPLLLVAAVGTTLLLARFMATLETRIEQTHPNPSTSSPWGLALPWGALVGVGLAAPLWLPVAFPPLDGAAVPSLLQDLTAATLPVLAGLAVAWAVVRRPGLLGSIRKIRVPAGDLLIPVEALVRRVAVPGRTAANQAAWALRRGALRIRTFAESRIEAVARRDPRLMRSPLLGSLLLALVLFLVFALV